MSKKRRQYSPQFKSKVALEAIQGVKTVPELSSQHSIHPSLINQWKRHLVERASGLFETAQASKTLEADSQAKINELYRQIGKLTVERDFLAERSAQLGLSSERRW
jgi:transposase-like protein